MMRYALTTQELMFLDLNASYRAHKWESTDYYLYRISTDREYEWDMLAQQPGFVMYLPGLNTQAFKKDKVTSNLHPSLRSELARVGITPDDGDTVLDLMRAWRTAVGGHYTDFDIST